MVFVLVATYEVLKWLLFDLEVSGVVEFEVIQMVLLFNSVFKICISLIFHDVVVILGIGKSLVHFNRVSRYTPLELIFTPAQVGSLHSFLFGFYLHLLPPFYVLGLSQLELVSLLDTISLIWHIRDIFKLVMSKLVFLREYFFGLFNFEGAFWLALSVKDVDLLLFGVKHTIVHIDYIYLHLFDIFKTIVDRGMFAAWSLAWRARLN